MAQVFDVVLTPSGSLDCLPRVLGIGGRNISMPHLGPREALLTSLQEEERNGSKTVYLSVSG